MDFSPPIRQPKAESIVPMINVVFLLLIFFLMTSEISAPDPFEITQPTTAIGAEPKAEIVLYAAKTGQLQFLESKGEAVFATLSQAAAKDVIVQLRADAGLEAVKVAAILSKLTAAGFESVELVVAAQ